MVVRLGLVYETFQIYVFSRTAAIVILFSVYFSWLWYWAFEAKQRAPFATTVLEYLKLLQSATHKQDSQRTSTDSGSGDTAKT